MLKEISRQTVFESGKYFPQAHASTLAFLNGRLFIACFGGSGEGRDDVCIHIAAYDGQKFEYVTKICAAPGVAHWNPVLWTRPAHGEKPASLRLWFKVAHRIPDWQTMYCDSDDGYSWSRPASADLPGIPARGPVKNKPFLTSGGILIAPRSLETPVLWTVCPEYSYDFGDTWNECGPVELSADPAIDEYRAHNKRSGCIQPSIWEDEKGIHMLMRSTFGRLLRSDSADGKSWSEAYFSCVPNNNSGVDLVSYHGRVVLVCNPTDTSERTPLCAVQYSGNDWTKLYTLEDGEGEYSYPAVITDGEKLYISYTWQRRTINLAVLQE